MCDRNYSSFLAVVKRRQIKLSNYDFETEFGQGDNSGKYHGNRQTLPESNFLRNRNNDAASRIHFVLSSRTRIVFDSKIQKPIASDDLPYLENDLVGESRRYSHCCVNNDNLINVLVLRNTTVWRRPSGDRSSKPTLIESLLSEMQFLKIFFFDGINFFFFYSSCLTLY